MVTGNIHDCLWSLISSFKLYQIRNAAEGKIHRILSKLSMMWSGLFLFLDVRTHFKPTETFQYTHFDSCHPPGVRKGFIKGEALRLLRTNSSKAKFDEHIALFKQRLRHSGYPDNLLNMILPEVNFSQRMSALQNKQKTRKRILPFVTEYRPSMPDLKHILMNKWHLIQNQPLLRKIFKNPPLISYRKGRSLKDVLVRAKL